MRLLAPRHALGLAAAAALASCTPSASVKQTTPVANLQSYGVVAVRAAQGSIDHRLSQRLVDDTVLQLTGHCHFHRVMPAEHLGNQQPDLIIDLNIRSSTRGGGGLIQNANKAVVEVLVVLSDGISQDLLGTAWFSGESAAVLTGAESPEHQAVGAVARELGQVLTRSGCTGTRVARAPEPGEGEDEGGGGDAASSGGVDPERLTRAEALNEEGKKQFLAGEMDRALGSFQQAAQVVPDARFQLNICLAYEALKRYDEAIATCELVATQTVNPRVAAKASDRLAILGELKKSGR
jgi:tetratricopeptide (TPR) repeat protein